MMQAVFSRARQLSWTEWALLFNALTIIHLNLVPFGIVFLAIAVLIDFLQKRVAIAVKIYSVIFLCIPFIVFCIGFINTENFTKAFEDLGRILPFILFPFLLIFTKSDPKLKQLLLHVFIIGLLTYFLYHLTISFVLFSRDGAVSHFFYSSLVENTNSFSIFNMFAITALMEYFLKNSLAKSRHVFVIATLFFLVLIQLQMQSRVMILVTLFSLILLFFIFWKRKKKWWVICLLAFSVLLFQLPVFQGRFQSGISQTNKIRTNVKLPVNKDDASLQVGDCNSSVSLRYLALISGYEIIVKHPIVGVGSGDWLDELVANYKKNNRLCNLKRKTAPHNQYLRLLIKHGLLGFSVFIFYFVFLFRTAIKEFQLAQLSFLFCLVFSSVGYDLMDGGATAPFVAFFASILFLKSTNQLSYKEGV